MRLRLTLHVQNLNVSRIFPCLRLSYVPKGSSRAWQPCYRLEKNLAFGGVQRLRSEAKLKNGPGDSGHISGSRGAQRGPSPIGRSKCRWAAEPRQLVDRSDMMQSCDERRSTALESHRHGDGNVPKPPFDAQRKGPRQPSPLLLALTEDAKALGGKRGERGVARGMQHHDGTTHRKYSTAFFPRYLQPSTWLCAQKSEVQYEVPRGSRGCVLACRRGGQIDSPKQQRAVAV